MRQLKSKVRTGLKELQEKGYLEAYEVTRDDQVMVSKTKDSAVKFESQIWAKPILNILSIKPIYRIGG